MQDRHVPYLAPHYWVVLSIASVAGANTGDFVSQYLGIGHVRGLPVLVLVFAAILAAERREFLLHTTWYWLAVLAIRTASTNIADFLTVDLHLGRPATLVGLALTLFAIFPMARSEARLLMSSVLMARPPGRARPVTDAGYWSALIVAGTLGTVLGDWCSTGLGLGGLYASLLLVVVSALVFALHATSWISRLRLYWVTIVLLLATGTTLADLLVRDPRLHLGLLLSTALSVGAMAIAVWWWRHRTSEPSTT